MSKLNGQMTISGQNLITLITCNNHYACTSIIIDDKGIPTFSVLLVVTVRLIDHLPSFL